jgi:DNA-binding MarR family transcriptional regulator
VGIKRKSTMTETNYRLNKAQIENLTLIYTFRYVSIPLLAKLKNVHISTISNSLESLYQKGLLNKKYDKSFKLLGKPAGYSLNPNGVKAINEYIDVNKKFAHSMYKNATASENFMNQSLDIMAVYTSIKDTYRDAFTMFTRAETIDYEDSFPKTLPSLYLTRNDPSVDYPNHYMLDILTGVQKNVLYKKIDMYIDHFESGDWSEDEHPVILLVLDNSYIEDVVQKIAEERKDSRFIEDDELVIMTTTRKAILSSGNKNIWSGNNRELVGL